MSQIYMSCSLCREVKSTVNLALNEGWQWRDGVWLCRTCLHGTKKECRSSFKPEDLESDWLPDEGWC